MNISKCYLFFSVNEGYKYKISRGLCGQTRRAPETQQAKGDTTKGEGKVHEEKVRTPKYKSDKLYNFPYYVSEKRTLTLHQDNIRAQSNRHCISQLVFHESHASFDGTVFRKPKIYF